MSKPVVALFPCFTSQSFIAVEPGNEAISASLVPITANRSHFSHPPSLLFLPGAWRCISWVCWPSLSCGKGNPPRGYPRESTFSLLLCRCVGWGLCMCELGCRTVCVYVAWFGDRVCVYGGVWFGGSVIWRLCGGWVYSMRTVCVHAHVHVRVHMYAFNGTQNQARLIIQCTALPLTNAFVNIHTLPSLLSGTCPWLPSTCSAC